MQGLQQACTRSKERVSAEWEVIRLRAKDDHLGTVKSANEATALTVALKMFALAKEETDRLRGINNLVGHRCGT
jgi:hypothetical protein